MAKEYCRCYNRTTCTCNTSGQTKELRFEKTICVPMGDGRTVTLRAESMMFRSYSEPRWTQRDLEARTKEMRDQVNNVLQDELEDMGLVGKVDRVALEGSEKFGVR